MKFTAIRHLIEMIAINPDDGEAQRILSAQGVHPGLSEIQAKVIVTAQAGNIPDAMQLLEASKSIEAVPAAPTRKRRITHCWSCQRTGLDSSQHRICNCGGIICPDCGACVCDWS